MIFHFCVNVECRSSSLIDHTRSTAEHAPHTGGGCCVAAGYRAVGGLFEAPSVRLSGAAPCQSSDSVHLEHILQRALRGGHHGGQPGCGVVRDTSCLGARGSGACARCFRVTARFPVTRPRRFSDSRLVVPAHLSVCSTSNQPICRAKTTTRRRAPAAGLRRRVARKRGGAAAVRRYPSRTAPRASAGANPRARPTKPRRRRSQPRR